MTNGHSGKTAATPYRSRTKRLSAPRHISIPRNLAGNPDSPQAVIFLASITDVMMGS